MKKPDAWLLFRLWVPVLFWCILIFYLSSIPNLRAVESPFWDEIIRSILHAFVYTVLYLLFSRAINYHRQKNNLFLPFFFTFLYALSDEVHQRFVPTRSFQLNDLLVDSGGAFLGLIIIQKFFKKE